MGTHHYHLRYLSGGFVENQIEMVLTQEGVRRIRGSRVVEHLKIDYQSLPQMHQPRMHLPHTGRACQ